MRTADEIIEEIKVSSLSAEDLGRIMSAATTKMMANAFVDGGLDMMSDPGIWGRFSTSTGLMPEICGARGVGEHRGKVCVRDAGHPAIESMFGHRDKDGNEW